MSMIHTLLDDFEMSWTEPRSQPFAIDLQEEIRKKSPKQIAVWMTSLPRAPIFWAQATWKRLMMKSPRDSGQIEPAGGVGIKTQAPGGEHVVEGALQRKTRENQPAAKEGSHNPGDSQTGLATRL